MNAASFRSAGQGSRFPGADELAHLCATLDIPSDALGPFVEGFASLLSEHLVLSVDSWTLGIGVQTKGAGQAHAIRVAKFLEESGLSEAVIRRFLFRAKHFEYGNMYVKVEADGRGAREVSTAFEGRPSIEVAHAMLADSGVEPAAIGLMEAVAEVLEQQTVHCVGTSATRSGHSIDKMYFSQPAVLSSWDRLHTAATLCDLSDADWAPLASIRSSLNDHACLLSLAFTEGTVVPGLKLDLANLSRQTVTELLRSVPDAGRAERAVQALCHEEYGHVGICLVPEEAVRVKLYSPG